MSGHKRRAKFAPNRDSTVVKRQLVIPSIVSKSAPCGDPFDIPPMTPTTAVNSPRSDDPFQRFSSSFRPISQVYEQPGRTSRAYSNGAVTVLAQESQSVLPVGSDLSVDCIPNQQGVGSEERRWSQGSSTDDEDYVYARSPTNRHII